MKVPSVPVHYREVTVPAGQCTNRSDPLLISQGTCVSPTTLAGKIVKYLSSKDEVSFITDGIGSKSYLCMVTEFDSVRVRAQNSILNILNDRKIRPDLIVFDYITNGVRNKQATSKFVRMESSWYVQTRKEDVLIELCSKLERNQIIQPMTTRVRNWLTKKGSTAEIVPSVSYSIVMKVFDSPQSYYEIPLFTFDKKYPCGSDEPIVAINLDNYENGIIHTQKDKERIYERRTYFRSSKR